MNATPNAVPASVAAERFLGRTLIHSKQVAHRLPTFPDDPHWELLKGLYYKQLRVVEAARLHAKGGSQMARRHIARYGNSLSKFRGKVAGFPVFAGLGAAREIVVENPIVKPVLEIIDEIGWVSYQAGIGLMTGHFHQGFMGAMLRSWLTQRANADLSDVKLLIAGVPLLEGEQTGKTTVVKLSKRKPFTDLPRVDRVSPPHASFESRSVAIVCAACTVGCIYCPGGIGTAEELSRDMLGEQHALKSLTMWSGRPNGAMRSMFLLDYAEPDGLWYWDPLLLRARLDSRLKASEAIDWKNVHIIRIGDPSENVLAQFLKDCPVNVHWFKSAQEAALFMVTDGLRVFDSVRKLTLKQV